MRRNARSVAGIGGGVTLGKAFHLRLDLKSVETDQDVNNASDYSIIESIVLEGSTNGSRLEHGHACDAFGSRRYLRDLRRRFGLDALQQRRVAEQFVG
jgi:hypothetical protein